MGEDNYSLINLDGKPVTVFIEKVSDAIGGLAKPWQTKRTAKAEAEADKIKALADIEINEIQQRALVRFIQEEGRNQENMERITHQAIPYLDKDAKPEDMDSDWIVNFFDKCRLVSDKEMQSLWAKLLAGEANKPSSFSKRTVELVSTLDKPDAHLLTSLCSFAWYYNNEFYPLIYDVQHEIYTSQNINFLSLTHLDAIGLITFDNTAGLQLAELNENILIQYYGKLVRIKLPKEKNNTLDIGKVLLSKAGQELAIICGSTTSQEFLEYVVDRWRKSSLEIAIPTKNGEAAF